VPQTGLECGLWRRTDRFNQWTWLPEDGQPNAWTLERNGASQFAASDQPRPKVFFRIPLITNCY
jgi:hypothetical protein